MKTQTYTGVSVSPWKNSETLSTSPLHFWDYPLSFQNHHQCGFLLASRIPKGILLKVVCKIHIKSISGYSITKGYQYLQRDMWIPGSKIISLVRGKWKSNRTLI